MVFLRKAKLNTTEFLISKALIDSYIRQNEFVLVNNVLREYSEMKEEIKKSWNFCQTYYIKTMETYCVSCKKNSGNEKWISRKLNTIVWCFYQIAVFVAQKNWLSLTPLSSIQQF